MRLAPVAQVPEFVAAMNPDGTDVKVYDSEIVDQLVDN